MVDIIEEKDAKASTGEMKKSGGFYKFISNIYKSITNATFSKSQIESIMVDVIKECAILKQKQIISSVQEMDFLSRVFAHSVKMGWSGEMEEILSQIELVLNSSAVSENKMSFKGIYCSLWNCSLNPSIDPRLALSMQANAIKCLILGGDLQKACDMLVKVSTLCDANNGHCNEIEKFYSIVLSSIQDHFLSQNIISDEVLCKLNFVILGYAKCLFRCNRTKEFSKFIKEFVNSIDIKISVKIKIALKLSLKIADYAMVVLLKKCPPTPLLELLKNVKILPDEVYSQTIFVEIFIHLLDITQFAFPIPNDITVKIFNSALTHFSSRFSSSEVPKIGSKIFEYVGKYVKDYADIIMKPVDQRVISVDDFCSSISPIDLFINLNYPLDTKTSIYNIGIYYCNIGVICFKAENYSVACKFVKPGIEYLISYRNAINEEEKASVSTQIKKKVRLMQDALRYSKAFVETANFNFTYLDDFVEIKDVVSIWVKCKRDAYSQNDKTILKLTMKDAYESYLADSGRAHKNLNISNLLVKELQELKELSFDTSEDQLLVSKELSKCSELKYKVIGLVGICQALWRHEEYCEKGLTAISCIRKADRILQQYRQENEQAAIWLELSGQVSYWTYLCEYQILHQRAKNEIKGCEAKEAKEEKSRQTGTNLGDEPTPDAYSLRLFNKSRSLYDEHESIFRHLKKALDCMKEIVQKELPIERMQDALEMLMTMANIFRLSLLISLSVESFSIVLTIAKQYHLANYWIKGMTEILLMAPEIVNENGVRELQERLSAENTSDNLQDKLMALCAKSSYYLKNCMVDEGVLCLQKCFASPILEKNTMSSVAVHIIALHLASQYAMLPSKTFAQENPFKSSPFLAFYSTRKSLALIHFMQESSQDQILWPFKAGWLHYTSCQWLGTVCSMANDPRIGAAYVGQSLEMAQQQVLPLRVSKLYTILTEFDVLCDEMQNSRVKLDSLSEHLNFHHNAHKLSDSGDNEDKLHPLLEPDSEPDDEEDGFELKFNQDLLMTSSSISQNVIIGNEKRISWLTRCDALPESPYMRKKKDVSFTDLTFDQFLNCGICSSHDLCEVVSDFCLLSAQISSRDSNFPYAIRCIQEASKTLQRTKKLSTLTVKNLFQSLGIYFASNKVDFTTGNLRLSVYSDVHLRALYYHAEILAINRNLKQAKNINYKALLLANDSETVPNTFWIAKLLLQERILREAILKSSNADLIPTTEAVSKNAVGKFRKDESKCSPKGINKQKMKTKPPVIKISKTTKSSDYLASKMESLSIKESKKITSKVPIVTNRRTKAVSKDGLLTANNRTPENTTEALSLAVMEDRPKVIGERASRQTRSRTAKENVEMKQKKPANVSEISTKPTKLPKKNLRRL